MDIKPTGFQREAGGKKGIYSCLRAHFGYRHHVRDPWASSPGRDDTTPRLAIKKIIGEEVGVQKKVIYVLIPSVGAILLEGGRATMLQERHGG